MMKQQERILMGYRGEAEPAAAMATNAHHPRRRPPHYLILPLPSCEDDVTLTVLILMRQSA
jgi:hypothetical protein